MPAAVRQDAPRPEGPPPPPPLRPRGPSRRAQAGLASSGRLSTGKPSAPRGRAEPPPPPGVRSPVRHARGGSRVACCAPPRGGP